MQTSLTTAVTGAKTFFLAKADYTAATPAAMTAETGGLTYIGANVSPTGQNTVSVNGVSTNVVIFAGLSKSGSCFYVMDDQSSGVTSYAKLAGAGGCAATTITPIDLAWKTSW